MDNYNQLKDYEVLSDISIRLRDMRENDNYSPVLRAALLETLAKHLYGIAVSLKLESKSLLEE